MVLTQEEFETLIEDRTKKITEDIIWREDEDKSCSLVFKSKINSESDYPLVIVGRYNSKKESLSYAIIHEKVGRIYGLDIGQNHKNPSDGRRIGRLHKHRWTKKYGDKEAYRPLDITCPATDLRGVWKEFCIESKIVHEGLMTIPPINEQLDLFDII